MRGSLLKTTMNEKGGARGPGHPELQSNLSLWLSTQHFQPTVFIVPVRTDRFMQFSPEPVLF